MSGLRSKNADGTLSSNVRYTGAMLRNIQFQNAVTSPNNGRYLDVESDRTLTLEIYGTSAARTVKFEFQGPSGAWFPARGVKVSDNSYAIATETTGNGEMWQFDLIGMVNFRARVHAVSGGNVSIKGVSSVMQANLSPITGQNLNMNITGQAADLQVKLSGSNGELPVQIAKTTKEVVTSTLDLKGKISGSLLENPNIVKRGSGATPIIPTGSWVEGDVSVITPISNEDGTVYDYSSTTTGSARQMLFSFDILSTAKKTNSSLTIADLRTKLAELTAYFVGWGTSPSGGVATNGVTLRLWNNRTSSYDIFGGNTASSPTSTSVQITNFTDYISDAGYVHLHAQGTNLADGTIASGVKTDYVKAVMKLNAESPTVLSVQGRESLISKNQDATISIAAGGNETISIQASVGKIAELIHYGIAIPAISGATSGSHRVTVSYNTSGSYDRLLDVTAEAAQSITIVRGVSKGSSTLEVPSDKAVQLANCLGLSLSDTVALRITYINNSNAAQSATRNYRSVISERSYSE